MGLYSSQKTKISATFTLASPQVAFKTFTDEQRFSKIQVRGGGAKDRWLERPYNYQPSNRSFAPRPHPNHFRTSLLSSPLARHRSLRSRLETPSLSGTRTRAMSSTSITSQFTFLTICGLNGLEQGRTSLSASQP